MKIYTLNAINTHLDKYLIGQKNKKRLALAAAYPFALV
jgi:hypothetical protein